MQKKTIKSHRGVPQSSSKGSVSSSANSENAAPQAAAPSGILTGVRAALSISDAMEASEIVDMIKKLGGAPCKISAIGADATHLVFQSGDPGAYAAAQAAGIPCVNPNWLRMCEETNQRMTERFAMADPPAASPFAGVPPSAAVAAAAASSSGAAAAPSAVRMPAPVAAAQRKGGSGRSRLPTQPKFPEEIEGSSQRFPETSRALAQGTGAPQGLAGAGTQEEAGQDEEEDEDGEEEEEDDDVEEEEAAAEEEEAAGEAAAATEEEDDDDDDEPRLDVTDRESMVAFLNRHGHPLPKRRNVALLRKAVDEFRAQAKQTLPPVQQPPAHRAAATEKAMAASGLRERRGRAAATAATAAAAGDDDEEDRLVDDNEEGPVEEGRRLTRGGRRSSAGGCASVTPPGADERRSRRASTISATLSSKGSGGGGGEAGGEGGGGKTKRRRSSSAAEEVAPAEKAVGGQRSSKRRGKQPREEEEEAEAEAPAKASRGRGKKSAKDEAAAGQAKAGRGGKRSKAAAEQQEAAQAAEDDDEEVEEIDWEERHALAPAQLSLSLSSDPFMRETILGAVKGLGGCDVCEAPTPGPHVSHLVVSVPEAGAAPKRTLKILMAMARGLPVVTADWVLACVTAGKWLPHDGYLALEVHPQAPYALQGKGFYVKATE